MREAYLKDWAADVFGTNKCFLRKDFPALRIYNDLIKIFSLDRDLTLLFLETNTKGFNANELFAICSGNTVTETGIS